MKKILTLLLALLMILSLVGCNNKKQEETISHTHTYEADEDGVWICAEDNDILSNTDKPYVAVLENNEPKDIISLDSITSKKTNLGNGVIYKEDNTVFYNGNNAQSIIIKTEKDNKNNEDKVVINAPNDTIYHYGSSSVISLDAVATESFHEYGKVDLITLTKARIVLENESSVKEIYLDINNPSYNYESVIIAIKEEVKLPNLSRDAVDLKEGEVKTLAVIQQLKDEVKQDNTIETITEEESFVKIENVAKSDKDLIIQAFLSPNSDTKDNTKLETKQTSTITLEEAKEGSSHPASKNTFVSKDEKVTEAVKPTETPEKQEETKPVVNPTVTPKQEEKKDDPTPTPAPTPVVTKYTVTFDMQGHGTQIPSQSIEKNNKVTKPADPTADGYAFIGWYKEPAYTNEWKFDTDVVTSNTTIHAKWTQIIPIEKPTAVSGLEYTGEEQIGVAEGTGYTVVNGKNTNAGNYTATVKLLTGYKWSDGTTEDIDINWSIGKATYDMSSVTFEDKEVTYNGQEQKIEISGTLPQGVSVSYTNNMGTNAGTYEATASFTGDSINYEAIDEMTATLTIKKASLTATADDKNVTVGSEAPEYTITYTGWVEGESIETVAPKVTPVLACDYTTTSVAGEYDITFTTEPVFANYIVTAVPGKLTATPATITFAELIATQTGFPSTAESGWTNSNGYKMYYAYYEAINENSLFISGDRVTDWVYASDELIKTQDGYEYSWDYGEGYAYTVTFIMDSDTLTAVTIEDNKYPQYNGTYKPAVDKASYTLKDKNTWFSTLTSGTDIKNSSVTDIIFCKEVPSGTKVVDGVDLTANTTGKVKGYVVADGDNYKIYVVGDYIFGNADCSGMFNGFSKLTTLDLSNFDTSNVTNMMAMFNGCSMLTTLDLSKFDTSKVTAMNMMFTNCSGLTSLNLSKFDTSSVTNMASMFNGCSKLASLDLGKFNIGKVTSANKMFVNCAKLASVKVETENDTIKEQLGDAWIYASGAYTAQAPAAPLTIDFILNTYSDGLPTATSEKTAPDGAWKTTDGKSCYLYSNNLVFNNKTDSVILRSRSDTVWKSGDGYVHTQGVVKTTFNMNGEVLTSIAYYDDIEEPNYNGTYEPVAPAPTGYMLTITASSGIIHDGVTQESYTIDNVTTFTISEENKYDVTVKGETYTLWGSFGGWIINDATLTEYGEITLTGNTTLRAGIPAA